MHYLCHINLAWARRWAYLVHRFQKWQKSTMQQYAFIRTNKCAKATTLVHGICCKEKYPGKDDVHGGYGRKRQNVCNVCSAYVCYKISSWFQILCIVKILLYLFTYLLICLIVFIFRPIYYETFQQPSPAVSGRHQIAMICEFFVILDRDFSISAKPISKPLTVLISKTRLTDFIFCSAS